MADNQRLREIVVDLAASVGGCEISRPERLTEVTRTAFTWTPKSGSMCLAADRSYFDEALKNPNIICIVASEKVAASGQAAEKCLILSESSRELFYLIHNEAIHTLRRGAPTSEAGAIHPGASIAETARLGPDVSVGEGSMISDYCVLEGKVVIGAGCRLDPHVTVGTEGFFSKFAGGRKIHVQHFGGVSIGDNCYIHAGSNISRSVNYDEFTTLEQDVHVGIHSNIGHDCHVGKGSDISAGAFLLGRVRVGRNSWIGANAVLSNAVSVGSGARVRIGAVVIDDLPDNGDVSGNFAVAHGRRLREHVKDRRGK